MSQVIGDVVLKNCEINKVVLEAKPGKKLSECIKEVKEVLKSTQTKTILIHNDKLYIIKENEIINAGLTDLKKGNFKNDSISS